MPKLSVSSTTTRSIVMLTIDFDYEAIQKPMAYTLTNKFRRTYLKERDKSVEVEEASLPSSCAILIKPEYATSTLNNAIFELWRTVTQKGGVLVCVDYPQEYVRSLRNLGMFGLDGFSLSAAGDAAIQKSVDKLLAKSNSR